MQVGTNHMNNCVLVAWGPAHADTRVCTREINCCSCDQSTSPIHRSRSTHIRALHPLHTAQAHRCDSHAVDRGAKNLPPHLSLLLRCCAATQRTSGRCSSFSVSVAMVVAWLPLLLEQATMRALPGANPAWLSEACRRWSVGSARAAGTAQGCAGASSVRL